MNVANMNMFLYDILEYPYFDVKWRSKDNPVVLMSNFLYCNSIEPGIGRIRTKIDTIDTYFEYDGKDQLFDDEKEFLIDVKCPVILTQNGTTYYVRESLEDIDNKIEEHEDRERLGFKGGYD
jgi:hypothetical protein